MSEVPLKDVYDFLSVDDFSELSQLCFRAVA